MRRALFIFVVSAIAGCGEVHFVVSPYAPQNVQVYLASSENLTVVTWQLGENIDLSVVKFQFLLADGWTDIDFDDAPYPAGQFPCASGTCLQYNFPWSPPTVLTNPDPMNPLVVLRAIHPEQGILYGSDATTQTVPSTLSFSPRLEAGNQAAELQVTDFFTQVGAPKPRTFNWQIISQSPSCPQTTTTWAGATSGNVVPFTGTLNLDTTQATDPRGTDNGDACMLIQPVLQSTFTNHFHGMQPPLSSSFAPVILSQELPAHPVLEADTTQLDASVEQSPVLYLLLYSLDIPNETLCESTISQIEGIFSTAFDARNSTSHFEFPSVNFADNGTVQCSGNPNAWMEGSGTVPFDGAATVEAINEYVDTQVSEPTGAKVVIVYIANGSVPPSDWFVSELTELEAGLTPRATAYFWAISANAALPALPPADAGEFSWDSTTAWTAPTDPAFTQAVTVFANQNLPFMSVAASATSAFPLLAPQFQDIANTYTTFIKICSYLPITMTILDDGAAVATGAEDSLGDYIAQLRPSDDYQFQPSFSTLPFTPFRQYMPQTAIIRYEICTNYCHDPFQSASGEWFGVWSTTPQCREAF